MRISLAVLLLAVATTAPTFAQALIADPFDAAVAQWTFPPGTATWSNVDSSGHASSGSAKLTNMSPAAGGVVRITRCTAITGPVDNYVLGGRFRVAAGVTAAAEGRLELNFYNSTDCTGGALGTTDMRLGSTGTWSRELFAGPFPASVGHLVHSASLAPSLHKAAAGGSVSGHFDDVLFGVNDAASLNGERFFVGTAWKTGTGQIGLGDAVELTPDSAYFWFFAPTNVEAIVKVLNACTLNQRYWVFAGGLTNVETSIVVSDSQGGGVKSYLNPQGKAFLPIQDTQALVACP